MLKLRKMVKYVGYGVFSVMLSLMLQSNVFSQTTDTTYRTPGTGSGSSGTGSYGTGSSGTQMHSDTSGRYTSGFYSQADSLVRSLGSDVTSLSDNQKSQIRQILMDLRDDYSANKSRSTGTDNETGETSGRTMQSQQKMVNDAMDQIDNVLDENQKQEFSKVRDSFSQSVRTSIMSSSSNMNNNGSGSGSGSNGSGSNPDNSGSGSGSSGTGSGSGTGSSGTGTGSGSSGTGSGSGTTGSGSGSGSGSSGTGTGTGTGTGSGSGSGSGDTGSGSGSGTDTTGTHRSGY